jgi:hypothetical protein
LTDAPTFQWMGMEQQPGTVKVFGPEGVIWSAENINLTKDRLSDIGAKVAARCRLRLGD